MGFMNKILPERDIPPCRLLPESPYDPGRANSLQNQPEITSKMDNGWGGARANSGGSRANSGGAREGAGRKPKPRILQRATGPRWYVFEMMRGQENRIVRDLLEGEDRRGYIQRPSFEICQPRIVVEVVRAGKRQAVHQNMFVGYAFCHLDARVDPWPLIKQVEGVLRIFTTNSINPDTGNVTPIPVPVGFVEGLIETAPQRLRLAAVRLPEYARGQALRVESGPFAGHPAVCVVCDGLTTKVSIHLFGRDVEIVLPRSELTLVEADRRSQHDRQE